MQSIAALLREEQLRGGPQQFLSRGVAVDDPHVIVHHKHRVGHGIKHCLMQTEKILAGARGHDQNKRVSRSIVYVSAKRQRTLELAMRGRTAVLSAPSFLFAAPNQLTFQ
jgi:hypothetical protein